MDDAQLLRRLAALDARLDAMAQRLDQIGSLLSEATTLRAQLVHEIDSRRALADQMQGLIEVLGEARKQVRWLEAERARASGATPKS
ncbi:MAG: hypothetical protein U1F36_11570 [Planctomycetota bacterium]